MKSPSLLAVNNLSVTIKGRKIIQDISLTLSNKEFISIVGPSGSGKSTLLHALSGFIPSVGSISRPEKIGIALQSGGVFPFMNVEENIRFAIGPEGDDRMMDSLLDSLLQKTGLAHFKGRYPHELSGGQAQRLNFARAFASQPALLFCDEPFSSLDEIKRTEMWQWLSNSYEEQSLAVLLVTHSIEEALFLSDEVIVMKNGEITSRFVVPFTRPRAAEVIIEREFLDLKKEILSYFL